MEPAPFPTTAEAVADAVAEGLAKNRTVVWAPPVLRAVFSVFRHLPRPLWRKVAATR
jgi:decaprenylphospho-beta-D-erythro-pentofuranosid-2-ulose 2-reductase